MVCVFLIAGIHLHLVRIQGLYFRRDTVPGWESRITRGEFGVCRNHAELLLSRECFFAQLVPALIELALVLIAPFLWYLVWRMSCPGREVEKERFVWRLRFLITNPVNRVFHHRVIQIKVLVLRHADDAVIFCKDRVELAAFSSEKSPEIIKAKALRQSVERASGPLLRVGCKVQLANCCRVVAIALKDLCDGSGTRRPVGAIAWPPADQL